MSMIELSNSQIMYRKHLLDKMKFRDFYINKIRLKLELNIPEHKILRFEDVVIMNITNKSFTALCGCQNEKQFFTWDEYDTFVK